MKLIVKLSDEKDSILVLSLLFELCASFYLSSPEEIAKPRIEQSWQHGSGRTCFERTIDKELYPPDSKNISPIPVR